MKRLLLLCVSLLFAGITLSAQTKKDGTPDMRFKANKQVYSSSTSGYQTYPSVTVQNGYVKSNGTYVEPYYKTNRNATNHDNFSTSGNQNPYTGTTGYRARDYSTKAYNYGRGKQIQTGSKGGQYYINKNGNKTYVPKRTGW